ncbi:MAG: hypothetical protein RLZZ225_981 [Pseudomonadota bacterium]
MNISQQEVFVQDQSKIKTLFLTKSIPFLLAIGSFFLAWLLLGRFDWYIPFKYADGDCLYAIGFIRRLMDSFWYSSVGYIGFPFGSSLLDYPSSDAGNFAVLKLLLVLTRNLALTFNLYALLGFSVTAVACYCVLEKLLLSKSLSLAAAIIFTFLPFHFNRLMVHTHIFLCWYFCVPIFTWFAYKIYSKQTIFFQSDRGYKQIIAIIIALLALSCFGVYYSFFSLIIFIGSGIVGSLKWKSGRNIYSALISVAIVIMGVSLNLAPNINYWFKNGFNQDAVTRYSFESEIYGLKMIQMLLPHDNHRSSRLKNILKIYEKDPFLINENSSASLGIIGTMGFLALLTIFLFFPFIKFQIDDRIQLLSFLSIFLFLFATIGGFSSIFNTFVTPMIRAWNRASIFINFFSIVGFFVFVEIIIEKISNPKYLKGNLIIAALLLTLFGVYEQSLALIDNKANLKATKKLFLSDKYFTKKIEQIIPRGTVYQLPYMPFPEVASINSLASYGLFRGYIHSSTLHWSYGGMKGRKGDLFFRNLANQSLSNQIKAIKTLGFNGVYIDRRGYVDRGKVVETELRKLLSVKPLISEDENLVFFSMANKKK